ncbi:MAG: hypothetical protein ACLQD9_00145 [Thermoplasmata archaeon]
MELSLRPRREAASEGSGTKPGCVPGAGATSAGSGHFGEILESQDRMLGGQLIDQGAGEGMEAGADAIALSLTFLTEKTTRDPSVVRLLST